MADAHDLTTSIQLGDWILSDQTFATDRGPDPADPELERIRDHYTCNRYRYLKSPFTYDPPINDTLNGIGVAYRTGVTWAETDPTLTWKCTFSKLELLGEGTDMLRESQTWEYLGAWGDFT